MTITSIHTLPSGKTGVTITSNLDELAILRGLVINALRHMPDVCETVATRQRLKAMSRALHKVYSNPKAFRWNEKNEREFIQLLKDNMKNVRPEPSGLEGPDDAPKWTGGDTATLDAEQEGKLRAAAATKNPTIWSIYQSMPTHFYHTDFVKKSTKHGVDTTNASDFLHFFADLGFCNRLQDGSIVKVVSPI